MAYDYHLNKYRLSGFVICGNPDTGPKSQDGKLIGFMVHRPEFCSCSTQNYTQLSVPTISMHGKNQ
jgi:hypothetical protein